jgi:hypothetical protein
MKHILTTILAFCAFSIIAQQTFVRQNVTTSIHYSIGDVFSNALNGDTIHLPGGAFSIGTLVIDKQLTIFGAGHHPDSTTATYATTLTGNMTFRTSAASNSTLTGVALTGLLRFGTIATDSDINNFTLRRCQVGEIVMSFNGSTNSQATNIIIDGNTILGNIAGVDAQFVFIQNNLITGYINNFNGNLLVKNNTFFGGTGCPSVLVTDTYSGVFENNVFMNNGLCGNITINSNVHSSIFTNNVFNANYTFPYGTNIGSGNYPGISFTGFFVNETDFAFSYTNDYHLTNPLTHLGNDGTQCGMYGGTSPYKAGAVPVNPHISSKTIAPQTTPTGDLNINITVGAQDN